MARSNQGGSILSFLVIGGILVAALIGGAYFVQQRATRSTADKTPAATQTADKKAAPAEDKKVTVEPKKEEAKKEASKTDTTPKKETPKAVPQTATSPATELPKTGPTELISSILGAGLLSGMIVAYVRSRRLSATL